MYYFKIKTICCLLESILGEFLVPGNGQEITDIYIYIIKRLPDPQFSPTGESQLVGFPSGSLYIRNSQAQIDNGLFPQSI